LRVNQLKVVDSSIDCDYSTCPDDKATGTATITTIDYEQKYTGTVDVNFQYAVPKVHLNEAFVNLKMRDLLYDPNITNETLFSEATSINTDSTNPRFNTPDYHYDELDITPNFDNNTVTIAAKPTSTHYEGSVILD
jgi:hypothetical protein